MLVESLVPWAHIGHDFHQLRLCINLRIKSPTLMDSTRPQIICPLSTLLTNFSPLSPTSLSRAPSEGELEDAVLTQPQTLHTCTRAVLLYSCFHLLGTFLLCCLEHPARLPPGLASSLILNNLFSLYHWFPFVIILPLPWSLDHLSPQLGHSSRPVSMVQFVSAVMANSRHLINTWWMSSCVCMIDTFSYLWLSGQTAFL